MVHNPLINSVIPQCKQLLHQLIRLVIQGIMVQNIRDEVLAILDLRSGFPGEIEVHIHVLHVRGRIDWDFIVP